MFKAIKDSWFFSKAATYAMQEFGIDLMKADKATNGLVSGASKEAREHKFSVEEAASSCVVIASLGLAKILDLQGQRPDYSKMHDIERKIMMLSAAGKIREPVQDRIEGSIKDYYTVMEKKTGVPNDYPQ